MKHCRYSKAHARPNPLKYITFFCDLIISFLFKSSYVRDFHCRPAHSTFSGYISNLLSLSRKAACRSWGKSLSSAQVRVKLEEQSCLRRNRLEFKTCLVRMCVARSLKSEKIHFHLSSFILSSTPPRI